MQFQPVKSRFAIHKYKGCVNLGVTVGLWVKGVKSGSLNGGNGGVFNGPSGEGRGIMDGFNWGNVGSCGGVARGVFIGVSSGVTGSEYVEEAGECGLGGANGELEPPTETRRRAYGVCLYKTRASK